VAERPAPIISRFFMCKRLLTTMHSAGPKRPRKSEFQGILNDPLL
jgi:hypothetical protein